MLLTSTQAQKKYGTPSRNNPNLVLWVVPTELHIPTMPVRMYVNKDMINPLSKAFKNIIERDLQCEVHTYDGCFNIRTKRGLTSMSLHSWALAIDINAFENPLGHVPKMSKELVSCFVDAGFDWGGTWKRPDGMHFQLKVGL